MKIVDIRSLMQLDASDPIFDEIQQKHGGQLHHKFRSGKGIVQNMYSGLLAENYVADKFIKDGYSVKFLDPQRYLFYIPEGDESRSDTYKAHGYLNAPDLEVLRGNEHLKIEVKCTNVANIRVRDDFLNGIYTYELNPQGKCVRNNEKEQLDVLRRYIFHDADKVIVVPKKSYKGEFEVFQDYIGELPSIDCKNMDASIAWRENLKQIRLKLTAVDPAIADWMCK